MNKATKIKIKVHTDGFSIPLPAFSFSFIKRVSGWVLKMAKKHAKDKDQIKNLDIDDILKIVDILAQHEPFELADIDSIDDKGKRVIVKIYTY